MKAIVAVNNKGINAMAIKNTTATRMAVIAKRAGDITIAAAKAMMIELWKEKARNGEVLFAFSKRDGSTRVARGTIKFAGSMINGRGESRENYATCAWMDLDDNMKWKSFRWESLIWVK